MDVIENGETVDNQIKDLHGIFDKTKQDLEHLESESPIPKIQEIHEVIKGSVNEEYIAMDKSITHPWWKITITCDPKREYRSWAYVYNFWIVSYWLEAKVLTVYYNPEFKLFTVSWFQWITWNYKSLYRGDVDFTEAIRMGNAMNFCLRKAKDLLWASANDIDAPFLAEAWTIKITNLGKAPTDLYDFTPFISKLTNEEGVNEKTKHIAMYLNHERKVSGKC